MKNLAELEGTPAHSSRPPNTIGQGRSTLSLEKLAFAQSEYVVVASLLFNVRHRMLCWFSSQPVNPVHQSFPFVIFLFPS